MSKASYVCDPLKNHECPKTSCIHNSEAVEPVCGMTTKKEYAAHNSHIAFKCMDCNLINVFPINRQDGNCCAVCGGFLNPIGNAVIIGIDFSRANDMTAYPRSK